MSTDQVPPPRPPTAEQRTTVATVAGVLVIVVVVVLVNLVGRSDGDTSSALAGAPSASATATASTDYDDPDRYEALTSTAPTDVAESALAERGEIVEQPTTAGSQELASAAEKIARAGVSYSFTMASFNILGSQHTAPGGDATGYAPGRVRAEWAAALVASYDASIVGLQEVQADQLDALAAASGGTSDFWPGTSLGGVGIPQSVMWDNRVWQATYTGSLTIPFVGTTRPQPIVRLQHVASGREIYVINIHNSPQDRQAERDQALAIEVAAINELRRDGIPVFIMGDFNERDRAFCTITGRTDLLASNGGAVVGGSCRPPAGMRIDWIFASPDAQLSGHRTDDSVVVNRITDHAVITTEVTVP
ncbi:MAG: endonuclease/exonuclease/phosphatase family protein [Nocardioides sp.]|nr:endonuclease/exonuclease/phosphatase family protein [Nocardioides sp.]